MLKQGARDKERNSPWSPPIVRKMVQGGFCVDFRKLHHNTGRWKLEDSGEGKTVFTTREGHF